MLVLQAQTWQKSEPKPQKWQPDAFRDGAKLAMSEKTCNFSLPKSRPRVNNRSPQLTRATAQRFALAAEPLFAIPCEALNAG